MFTSLLQRILDSAVADEFLAICETWISSLISWKVPTLEVQPQVSGFRVATAAPPLLLLLIWQPQSLSLVLGSQESKCKLTTEETDVCVGLVHQTDPKFVLNPYRIKMLICGKKSAVMCSVLSAWGVLMLVSRATFCHPVSPAVRTV